MSHGESEPLNEPQMNTDFPQRRTDSSIRSRGRTPIYPRKSVFICGPFRKISAGEPSSFRFLFERRVLVLLSIKRAVTRGDVET